MNSILTIYLNHLSSHNLPTLRLLLLTWNDTTWQQQVDNDLGLNSCRFKYSEADRLLKYPNLQERVSHMKVTAAMEIVLLSEEGPGCWRPHYPAEHPGKGSGPFYFSIQPAQPLSHSHTGCSFGAQNLKSSLITCPGARDISGWVPRHVLQARARDRPE